MSKKNWNLAGLIIGVVAVVLGVVFIFAFKNETFSGSYSYLGSESFGGDFYTSSYRATAFAANAVAATYEMISTCFGIALVFLGAVDICCFGSRIWVVETENTKPEAPTHNKVPESTGNKNFNNIDLT